MSNKIVWGLKNVYYAVVTESGGSVAYSSPLAIPGAVNLTLSPAGERVVFYADDQVYYEEDTNDGYAGTLEISEIPNHFRTGVLGDATDANGALTENTKNTVKKIALMFEFSGDVKATRHVMYNLLPKRPNIEGSTKKNPKEPKTSILEISARPALDTGDIRTFLRKGDTGYDTFFTAVYLKSSVVNTAGADPADFSKGSPANVEFTSTSTGVTAVKNVLVNGLPVPGVSLTIAALKVTIDQAYISGLSLENGKYPIVCEFTKGNSVAYTLTVKA